MFVSPCGFEHMSAETHGAENPLDSESPATGVTRSCEPPNTGVGNRNLGPPQELYELLTAVLSLQP